jgi:hypothetical protein
VIRREDLTHCTEAGSVRTGAEGAALLVKAGESVLIRGLGTLARVEGRYIPGGVGPSTYRLTLTAAVAKASHHPNPHARAVLKEWQDVKRDVRHLARALGAPVEAWSPKGMPTGVASTARATPITSVSP